MILKIIGTIKAFEIKFILTNGLGTYLLCLGLKIILKTLPEIFILLKNLLNYGFYLFLH